MAEHESQPVPLLPRRRPHLDDVTHSRLLHDRRKMREGLTHASPSQCSIQCQLLVVQVSILSILFAPQVVRIELGREGSRMQASSLVRQHDMLTYVGVDVRSIRHRQST